MTPGRLAVLLGAVALAAKGQLFSRSLRQRTGPVLLAREHRAPSFGYGRCLWVAVSWTTGLDRAVKPASAPQRILISGGAGFIGSHLCRRLLGMGHDVVTGPSNLGHPVEFTMLALAARVLELVGGRRRPNIESALDVWHGSPTVPLDDGLRRTVEYFRGIPR